MLILFSLVLDHSFVVLAFLFLNVHFSQTYGDVINFQHTFGFGSPALLPMRVLVLEAASGVCKNGICLDKVDWWSPWVVQMMNVLSC